MTIYFHSIDFIVYGSFLYTIHETYNIATSHMDYFLAHRKKSIIIVYINCRTVSCILNITHSIAQTDSLYMNVSFK